jgi:TRAP transporter 4TM/12TM fusion protein
MLKRASIVWGINVALTGVALVAAAYHIIMVQWRFQDTISHTLTHVFLVLTLSSLAIIPATIEAWEKPANKVRFFLSLFCLAGTWISIAYFWIFSVHLEIVQPYIENEDLLIGILAVAVVLLVTILTWGPIIATLVGVGILYFFLGHMISGPLGHPEYDPQYVVSSMGASLTTGMFGEITRTSADAIFLLILFGALFKNTGILSLFLELGKAVGNGIRGGAAYPAIIGSAFLGTVTGAALANVALTGRMTIPAMKRSGFRPEQAAAIEAVASTGGQLAPPIMGSAAFVMATFLEVPYLDIMQMAIIPAFLYFAGAGIGVFFLVRSSKLNLPYEKVDKNVILTGIPVFLIPMGLLVTLLFMHYSPGFSAFWAIISLLVIAPIQKVTRPTFRQWIQSFADGAKMGAQIAVVLIAVGILAQAAITTNIATKLSFAVTGLVGDELVPILLISMVAGILLGMELPTPVAYVIMFITVVPMMIDVGVNTFAANFFAFYFAILSTLTPPIALSVLTASRLAESSFLATCQHSIKLSLIGYILPFAFVFNPALLGVPEFGISSMLSVAALLLAMIAGAAALYGYFLRPLAPPERLLHGLAVGAGIGFVFNGQYLYLLFLLILFVAGTFFPTLGLLRKRRHGRAA